MFVNLAPTVKMIMIINYEVFNNLLMFKNSIVCSGCEARGQGKICEPEVSDIHVLMLETPVWGRLRRDE